MLKFSITSDRFAEACNILEYVSVQNGNKNIALSVIHRFLVDKDGEYVVKIILDEEGDIQKLENDTDARIMMTAITPQRSEKLINQLVEAAKAIVNPPKGGDSNKPILAESEKPPAG